MKFGKHYNAHWPPDANSPLCPPPHPAVTSANVSRHFQMSLGMEDHSGLKATDLAQYGPSVIVLVRSQAGNSVTHCGSDNVKNPKRGIHQPQCYMKSENVGWMIPLRFNKDRDSLRGSLPSTHWFISQI